MCVCYIYVSLSVGMHIYIYIYISYYYCWVSVVLRLRVSSFWKLFCLHPDSIPLNSVTYISLLGWQRFQGPHRVFTRNPGHSQHPLSAFLTQKICLLWNMKCQLRIWLSAPMTSPNNTHLPNFPLPVICCLFFYLFIFLFFGGEVL